MRFFVCILVLLFVHNQFSRADKTLTDDSLYTEKYIRDIYIPEPRRALQLLDEAEVIFSMCFGSFWYMESSK